MWRAIGILLSTRKTTVAHDHDDNSCENFNNDFTNIGSDLTKTFTYDVTRNWSLLDTNYWFKFQSSISCDAQDTILASNIY